MQVADKAKRHWEKAINNISDGAWITINQYGQHFSPQMAIRETQFKTFHMWYLTPSRVVSKFSGYYVGHVAV